MQKACKSINYLRKIKEKGAIIYGTTMVYTCSVLIVSCL